MSPDSLEGYMHQLTTLIKNTPLITGLNGTSSLDLSLPPPPIKKDASFFTNLVH